MKFHLSLLSFLLITGIASAQTKFKVISFYSGKSDQAHISYVAEAHRFFDSLSAVQGFTYDSTNQWDQMTPAFLAQYDVVLFLDVRPEQPAQRDAFRQYMEKGGAWMGFHFAAFALTPSMYPQNWDWYHNTFLGSGSYVSNTWRPTSAILKTENGDHPALKHTPATFKASPNEWYRWSNDLTKNPDIRILLSIDPSSFPLGTGPKQHEIWHSGYYPVVWTNKNFRMIYMNMGHNDIDYEGKTNKTLSYTFANPVQARLVTDALLWLGAKK